MTSSHPSNWQPDEATTHAYVDGRLDPGMRARMDEWLEAHPARAAKIHGWQRDAQQLRAACSDLPQAGTPSFLDPARIRGRRRQRRRAQLAQVAVLLLTLGIGGVGGWQARHLAVSGTEAPMADAVQAYRMFAQQTHPQWDVVQHHPGELQAWLDRHFRESAPLPDLAAAGFSPVGGRLMATDSGAAAMVVYRNPRGDAISFYIRPPSARTGPIPGGERRDGQLATAYWSGGGYNYALVGLADHAAILSTDARHRPPGGGMSRSQG